jgi:transposase
MGKTHIPLLTPGQLSELEEGYTKGKTHVFRLRCHIVLLKHQGHTAQQITTLKGYPKHQGTINTWVSRYEKLGMKGLKNKEGQGRKAILSEDVHSQVIREIVKTERQRLDYAKSLIETRFDLKMSKKTLNRFLKTLAVSING